MYFNRIFSKIMHKTYYSIQKCFRIWKNRLKQPKSSWKTQYIWLCLVPNCCLFPLLKVITKKRLSTLYVDMIRTFYLALELIFHLAHYTKQCSKMHLFRNLPSINSNKVLNVLSFHKIFFMHFRRFFTYRRFPWTFCFKIFKKPNFKELITI